MKNEATLSKKQRDYARRVIADPVLFAKHVLGVEVWEKQAEILQSVKNNRRTAVKACHGVGKTFALAIAALWWLARYPEGIVLTTSATQRQVRTQLWSEIHRLVAGARVPYPPLKTTELILRDPNNFAIGFSTHQSENFQGYHGKYVLIIADEAPGIESGIWDAIAGTMAAGKVHIVMAAIQPYPRARFSTPLPGSEDSGSASASTPWIHQISKGSRLSSCCSSTPARVVRSIKIRFLT